MESRLAHLPIRGEEYSRGSDIAPVVLVQKGKRNIGCCAHDACDDAQVVKSFNANFEGNHDAPT